MADLNPRVEEQMRRVAAHGTEFIAKRYGRHLGMYLGCGYPKSGTTWLCQLMSSYLSIPFPQHYMLPIGMQAVLHGHWRYDKRLPPAAYIIRDGRDVITSFYFHEMRETGLDRGPRATAERHEHYRGLFGRKFDPRDVRANLPRFIEQEMVNPRALRGVTWAQHVDQWCNSGSKDVAQIRYEELLGNPVDTLATCMGKLTKESPVTEKARLAVEQYDFSRSGRKAGEEDRSQFMRKGIHGDWRNHFTRDAGEVFDRHAGATLLAYGYESDPKWFAQL